MKRVFIGLSGGVDPISLGGRSSPLLVIRKPGRRCEGFENLYIIGEGSGYTGGTISSRAGGIWAAKNMVVTF
jgi:hypothetical protein